MKEWQHAFEWQRANARRRQIEFCFEFEEWCQWWEAHLGPDWFQKRGNKKYQYCMARFHDKGAYVAGNVKCITNEQNMREAGTIKLTKHEVIKIFHAKGSYFAIAAQYHTTRSRVYRIKTGRVWKHLTQELLKVYSPPLHKD